LPRWPSDKAPHTPIKDSAVNNQAAEIFDHMSLTPDYPEFLTLPLYEAMA
jgi:malate synthase